MESEELAQSGQLQAVDGMGGLKVLRAPFVIDGQRPAVKHRSEKLGESTQLLTSAEFEEEL